MRAHHVPTDPDACLTSYTDLGRWTGNAPCPRALQRPDYEEVALLPATSTDLSLGTMKTVALYLATALAEIIGCYLPWLWLKQNGSPWLLVPAAISLAVFVWLLTLHAAASGRVYAAYGGVYIAVAIVWLWVVDGIRPSAWDVTGVAVALVGMSIIAFQPR